MSMMPGAEPFYFPGDGTGYLLIHGFTGTPNEMRWLGTQLSGAGHTVLGVLLAGHGTSPEDMNTTRWHDWYASVEVGYRRLRAECERVFVVGLSLGGALALHLGANEKPDGSGLPAHSTSAGTAGSRVPDGIVAMAAPVHLYDWRLTFFRPIQRFIPYWPKSESKLPAENDAGVDKAMHRAAMDYDRMPTACILSMVDFFKIVRRELPAIHVPTRFIYAPQDKLAPRSEVQFIYDRISSADKRMLSLDRSGHIVCDDVERETVLEAIQEFQREIESGSNENARAQRQLQSSGYPTAFH